MPEFDTFLLSLYRLARECPVERFMDEALDLLGRNVSFDSARLGHGALDAQTHERLGGHWHGWREREDILDAYMEVRSQDEPALQAIRQGGLGRVVNYESRERFGDRRFAGMRAYHRRFEHAANLTIFDSLRSGSRIDYRYVVAYRAREGRGFDERTVAFVSACWPHLKEAMAVNASLALHTLAASGSRMWSLCIADLGGRVLAGDPQAGELLRRTCLLPCEGSIPSPVWESLGRQGTFRGMGIVVTCERQSDLLFIRVRPCVRADALSPREAAVARRLAAGATHKEIARELGIAPATVRNHIQHVHEKLRAHNAAEVTEAVAPLRW